MIVSEQLRNFKIEVDILIEKGMKKDDALFNVLRELIKSTKKIRFEGDGYSEDWVNEAKKRGLNNFKSTPEALKAQISKSTLSYVRETQYHE